MYTKKSKPCEPDSEPEAADDIDTRGSNIARMIDDVKNVTAPKEVYLWESSPALLPAALQTAAAAAQDEGNLAASWAAALLKAAEDWLSAQAHFRGQHHFSAGCANGGGGDTCTNGDVP